MLKDGKCPISVEQVVRLSQSSCREILQKLNNQGSNIQNTEKV